MNGTMYSLFLIVSPHPKGLAARPLTALLFTDWLTGDLSVGSCLCGLMMKGGQAREKLGRGGEVWAEVGSGQGN